MMEASHHALGLPLFGWACTLEVAASQRFIHILTSSTILSLLDLYLSFLDGKFTIIGKKIKCSTIKYRKLKSNTVLPDPYIQDVLQHGVSPPVLQMLHVASRKHQ
jgi:hypothetical protein